MATLFNTQISATYPGLIKTTDNSAITATLKQLTDGSGNNTGLFLNNAGDFKVTAILEWGSLKDTGTGVTITQWVTAANGIANFNNDTTVPTSAAVKTYVDAVVTASDLDFLGDSNTGTPAVDLDSQNFSVLGTTNEIVTSGANQTLTIGLPNSVTISGTYTGATFAGDLSGTINTATTATTQSAGDNSTKVATTAYVDSLDAASDLDFSGDSGTGDVTLNTQVLAITGTTNQIVTAASGQGLGLSLPSTVHRNLQGNVTGNVTGDLTGNVTATSVLANGVTATTQTSSDSSTKVATTAYVKGLNNASDLDFTTDSGSGAVVLNTETLSVLGTTNQINSAGSGQAITLSLPATVHRNIQGNVTGDLTGNADTATAWETARNLSVTGEATGTLSNVNGTQAVSGAVTLDNNSVTGKVLTGLPTPAALTVFPTDSILEGIGKLQSQINGIANGLQFQGSWDANQNSPNLPSGGGEADSGTTTATLANKLVDTTAGQNFLSTVTVGDKVINQVDRQTALVTNVDSNTVLSIDADIMLSGEAYTIDNSPFITQGHYYVVNVGGNHNLNGINTWSVGDWVIAGATNVWEKLDHTDVEGVGTPGNIAKWSATGTIADSIIAESGAAITVTGSLSTTTNLNSGSNFAVNTDKFTANATTGNVAFPGDLAINTNKFTVNATSGNTVVAGTGSFGGNVDINGGLTVSPNTAGKDTFTLTTNASNDGRLLIKSDTTTKVDIQANGDSYFNGGDFGIGTDSPDTKLHVEGDGDRIQISSVDYDLVKMGAFGTVGADIDNGFFNLSTNGSEKIRLLATGDSYFNGGNVGINANDPVKTLDVRGSLAISNSASSYWYMDRNDATGNFDLNTDTNVTLFSVSTSGLGSFVNTSIGDKLLLAGDDAASARGLMFNCSTTTNQGDTWDIDAQSSTGIIKFSTGSSEKMRIDSSGVVNIGTATGTQPSYFHSYLNVQNNASTSDHASITITSGSGGFAGLHFGDSDNGRIGQIAYNNSNNSLLLTANNSTRLTIDSSGHVGIGVTPNAPAGNIQLDIGDTGCGMTSRQNNELVLQANANYDTYAETGKPATRLNLTNNGEFHFLNAPAGTSVGETITFTDRMRIDQYGGVGIGVVPEGNWINTTNVLQIGKGAAFWGTNNSNNAYISNNMFVNTNGNNHSLSAGGAAQYRQSDNIHLWYTSNVASAGNEVITLTERMRITSAGRSFFNYTNSTIETYGSGAYAGTVTVKALSGTSFGLSILNESIGGTSEVSLNFVNEFVANQFNYLARIIAVPESNWGGTASTRNSSLSFHTNSAGSDGEKMRITSGGKVLIGKTVESFSTAGWSFASDGSNVFADGVAALSMNRGGSDGNIIQFYKSNTLVGSILLNASSTSYNTSSDYRLKEDLQDFVGLDMVSKIPVYDFKWKTNENRSYGVMAHELQEVLPDAVSGQKDAKEMQGVDYSKIVPLLVKSIQELKAEVDLLKQECKCK
jgi:hypothetical protein